MKSDKVHLRLQNITKRFGETVAVNNVSFDIKEGTFTTLLGPSGCGKTTTLRMIAGFFDPTEGDIWLRDCKLNGLPPFSRPTSMVFQDYALFPHMSVGENVSYGLRMRREPKDVIARKVQRTLGLLGLEKLSKRRPDRLSGGQQQRVSLARSLVLEPEVLLLDEPLSNLDAKLRDRIKTELRAIQQQIGITTIYVTHDQDEALALSDWIAVMQDGKVAQLGTPSDVYYYPSNEFVADFVGTVSLIPGRVTHKEKNAYKVDTKIGQLVVDGDFTDVPQGESVAISVRPETIRIAKSPFPSGDQFVNTVKGEIKIASFLGKIARYWVEVNGVEIVVEHYNPGPGGALSGEVYLALDPSRLHILPKPTGNVVKPIAG